MKSVVIRGGLVVDPGGAVEAPRDVLLQNGLVAGVEAPGAFDGVEDAERLDATGCVVAPGFVDIHVHLREPGQTWKETIATGTRAAAAGGYTTVVAMPNTVPVNDRVETMRWMLDPARDAAVRVYAMPAVTVGSQGEELTDFEALAAAGALGFTDDGKPVLEDETMRAALRRAGRLGLPISQHAEDPRISHGAIMNAGPVAFRLGLRGYPAEAEARIVERDIALVREIRETEKLEAHLHVQHVSTALALEAIRAAKAEGLALTCEVSPHHFALTDEAVAHGGVRGEIAFDTNAKMNPPLRSEADRQAVIAAVVDGTVDCIATDHAPHALHEKEVEFARAPNGITGLETALRVTLRVLHQEHGVTMRRVIELLSTNPARVVKLAQAGSLRVGAWGDVTVFDPGAEWRFDAEASVSRSKNTPFAGMLMVGKVNATVVGGVVVFRG